jgi:hypothetical protein
MNRSWVPLSAAALVTGALALLLGALLTPMAGDSTASTLRVAEDNSGQWIAVAVMFILSSVGLLLGLPGLYLLFPGRGRTIGVVALVVTTVAAAGLTGYGMLLIFFNALVRHDALEAGAFDEVVAEPRLELMLFAWVGSFYLAELLLAIAVLRAGSAPRWVPVLFLVHVASFPLTEQLPEKAAQLLILPTALAFCGLAICANAEADRHEGIGGPVRART